MSAPKDARLEGRQRVNGAQTVESRAWSGRVTRYSDGTDALRAPIVPKAACAAVIVMSTVLDTIILLPRASERPWQLIAFLS